MPPFEADDFRKSLRYLEQGRAAHSRIRTERTEQSRHSCGDGDPRFSIDAVSPNSPGAAGASAQPFQSRNGEVEQVEGTHWQPSTQNQLYWVGAGMPTGSPTAFQRRSENAYHDRRFSIVPTLQASSIDTVYYLGNATWWNQPTRYAGDSHQNGPTFRQPTPLERPSNRTFKRPRIDRPEDSLPIYSVQRPGKSFFRVGVVFTTYWVQPGGKLDYPYTERPVGLTESTYGKHQYFVVVREGHNCCTCLPISTHGGKGTTGKPKNHHAIIYTSPNEPDPLPAERKHGEAPMGQSIRVIPAAPYNKLDPCSRVNFVKPQTVEHNIPVALLGRVCENEMWKFHGQFNLHWLITGPQELPPATYHWQPNNALRGLASVPSEPFEINASSDKHSVLEKNTVQSGAEMNTESARIDASHGPQNGDYPSHCSSTCEQDVQLGPANSHIVLPEVTEERVTPLPNWAFFRQGISAYRSRNQQATKQSQFIFGLDATDTPN